jgi:DNA-binding LytR/AlgR family response regulator
LTVWIYIFTEWGVLMYNIAILDDDNEFLGEFSRAIDGIMASIAPSKDAYSVNAFSSSHDLLSWLALGRSSCDIAFIDMRLGGELGLDIARRVQGDGTVKRIVYVSSYREYVFDSFDTHPIWYLLKPVPRSKLESVLKYDYDSNVRPHEIAIELGRDVLSMRAGELYYADVYHHRLTLHMASGERSGAGSMARLCAALPGGTFFRCHSSYVVNLAHVKRVSRYKAELDNGWTVPISKQRYNAFLDEYIGFSGRSMPV